MKQSLNLKVSQNLSLTPQLQQSIRILQLSAIELNSEIQEALDSNPLLEEGESTSSEAKQEKTNDQSENSEEWQDAFETRQTSSKTSTEGGYDIDATTANSEDLQDSLVWQLNMTTLSDKDKLIATSIIYSLNSQGYLNLSSEEILRLIPEELETDIDEIEAVLSLIKTFDPIGVAARDLRERLLFMHDCFIEKSLNKPEQHHIIARQIIDLHINLLGTRNVSQLKKLLRCQQTDLELAIQYITQINPHIASPNESSNNYVVPDIIVKKINNRWRVELNSHIKKNLKVNQTYVAMPKSELSGEANEYISKNLQEAKWFIKSLHNRYDTLKRVATAIVENQIEFFEQGEQGLKPMVLQHIATELDLHESTISRATAQKYMLTPLGVFELKYFFSSSLAKEDGTNVSSIAIRAIIKKIIDEESKQKPISDNKIAMTLDDQGYTVARRTVAKYREGMNIPSSSQRKSLF